MKICIIVTFFVMMGCASTINEAGDSSHAIKYSASYRLSLHNVDRPTEAISKYGESRIDTIAHGVNHNFFFEDRAIKTLWGVTSRFINCSILNKTDSTIKILWNEAAFVDERRATHPLAPEGGLFTAISPSIILKNTFFEASLYPPDYSFYPIAQAFGGPNRTTLFLDFELHGPINHGKYVTFTDFQKMATSKIGTLVQVLLPLKIEGIRYDYMFSFRVDSAKTTRTVHDIPEYQY